MVKTVFKLQYPCSNHEIHVPFEHGFWPSLVNGDATVFRRNKMANVKEALQFSVSFDIVNVIFKKFKVK